MAKLRMAHALRTQAAWAKIPSRPNYFHKSLKILREYKDRNFGNISDIELEKDRINAMLANCYDL